MGSYNTHFLPYDKAKLSLLIDMYITYGYNIIFTHRTGIIIIILYDVVLQVNSIYLLNILFIIYRSVFGIYGNATL